MKIYYSATEGGFFSSEVHGKAIPADSVEITHEQHSALLAGQSEGKQITAGIHGGPELSERPEPTEEEAAASARTRRDAMLSASDWIVTRSLEAGTPVPAEWADYRNALRSVTDQTGFPRSIEWPQPPA